MAEAERQLLGGLFAPEAKNLFLAPMAGVNDPAFRLICKEMGAALTYSEMISAKGMEYGNAKTLEMLAAYPGEGSFAVQLFGHEPQTVAAQAARLEELCRERIALIDVNMACPARKVAGKGDGAALLQDIHLAERILKAACAASHIPVTLKIRKGYYDSDDVVEDFARMAEQCGACAIAVHGRSAQQLYRGSADRNAVARAAAATGLPVIATGDVFTRRDADAYFTDFGASAVMAARGAQGNPWIFAAEREGGPPGTAERVAVARRHARALHDIMPKRLASMRKHFGWYFKGSPQAAAVRRSLNECRQLEDYLALLDSLGEQ